MDELEQMEAESLGIAEMSPEEVKSKKNRDDGVSYYENRKYILEQIKTNAGEADEAEYSTGVYERFILYNKKEDSFKIVKSHKLEGRTIYPIKSKLISKKSIYLPTGVTEYNKLESLIEEIKEYYNYYFEAPSFFQEFLPYYTIFTWVYDKFPFIPYLHFVGRTSTGKSWTAETVASLCYKAIDAAGSVTIASLFRSVNDWGGTVYLDEFDLKNFGSEGYVAMENFMKAGVSDRVILRVEGNKKKEVVPYTVKAPKIFTSETPISAAGLQSRTIVIQMEKNKKRLPLYKLNDYHDRGETLRNKLLLWRLRTLPKINLKEIEYGFEELETFDRRVQQVLTPIYYLAGKEARKNILEFAKKQEEETKRQRKESEEGSIFTFIFDYWNESRSNPRLKGITEQLNKEREDSGYKSKKSERKVGEVVRKILGFDTQTQGHEKLAHVMVDNNLDKLRELADYFGLVIPVEPTANSATSAEDGAEVFDDVKE